MRSGRLRNVGLCAATALRRPLLCLTALCVAAPLVFASDVRLHYEDAMEDVPATEASEKEIKAAFLLRFPDFVNWSKTLGDTLHIGVIGDDDLLAKLELLADQENRFQSGSRRFFEVRRVVGPADLAGCELLVLGEAVAAHSLSTVQAAHAAGVLTVGAWNEPRSGTIIRLYRDGSRVRFDISRSLAEEAGLRISSKLLNLAANSQTEGNLQESRVPSAGPDRPAAA